jgi:hypothetical protein
MKERLFKFLEGRHEGLGYEPAAIDTEIPPFIRYFFYTDLRTFERLL